MPGRIIRQIEDAGGAFIAFPNMEIFPPLPGRTAIGRYLTPDIRGHVGQLFYLQLGRRSRFAHPYGVGDNDLIGPVPMHRKFQRAAGCKDLTVHAEEMANQGQFSAGLFFVSAQIPLERDIRPLLNALMLQIGFQGSRQQSFGQYRSFLQPQVRWLVIGIIHHGRRPLDQITIQFRIREVHRATRLLHDQQAISRQIKFHGFQCQTAACLHHDQPVPQKRSPDNRAGLRGISLGHRANNQVAAGFNHDPTCDLHSQVAGIVIRNKRISSESGRNRLVGTPFAVSYDLCIQIDRIDIVLRFGLLTIIGRCFICAGFLRSWWIIGTIRFIRRGFRR